MMKIKSLLILALTFVAVAVNAQSVTVATFQLDETDATANMPGTTVIDPNGNKCALIKIETTKTGFAFDVGAAGVQDTRQKTGQIWVYVPYDVKHITLTHPKYAPCDFYFPDPLQKARTYDMELIISEDLLTQRLNITFSPKNAIILLDDELVEADNGSITMELIQGVHKYNAVAPGYTSESGTLVLNGSHTITQNIELQPNSKVIAAVDRYKPVQALPTDGGVAQQEEETVLEPKLCKVGEVEFLMLPVKGGTFMMGATSEQEAPDDDEKPIHQVTLYDYYMGETEVTQALWKAVMGENPSDSRMQGDDQPVQMVNWEQCVAFTERLSEISGMRFRLPTEAEWEYAARGGALSKKTQYSGSSAFYQVGWGSDNSQTKTHDVKQLQANELGIYDMSGNVAEWCSDWKGTYPSTPQISPEGPLTGQRRIIRGGSWNSYSEGECRVAARTANIPSARKNNVGFRLVLQ